MRLIETLAAASLAAATATAAAEPPAKIALTGARVITVSGGEIGNATILVEHGVITGVGAGLEAPYDAIEYDCAGMVIMPGMIDPHSARGLDVPNENVPVTPFLDVYDAIDPSRAFFEDSLRDGVTAVHVMVANDCVIGGLSRVVKPIGLSPDEMTIATDIGLKFSAAPKRGYDRMRQVAMLRDTFRKLDRALEELAEKKYEEKLKEDEKDMDVGPAEARERGKELIEDEDYDDQHFNLVRMRRGELAAWAYCDRAMDVKPIVDLMTDQGVLDNTVFVLGENAHKAVDEIKATERPVVLPANLTTRERDVITGEFTETFIPKVFADAGIAFALQPNPSSSLAERYLNYQAALCVRNGIPRDKALAAITLEPARMLGLEDQLGSIEEGKIANLVVFSGDPLDFSSWVNMVFIDGILAYDREKDPRLVEILGLERRQREAEEAAEAKDEAAEESSDESDESGDEGEGEEGSDDDGADAGSSDGNGNGNGEG